MLNLSYTADWLAEVSPNIPPTNTHTAPVFKFPNERQKIRPQAINKQGPGSFLHNFGSNHRAHKY